MSAGYRLSELVGKHGKDKVWEEINRLMDELGMEKWGMTRMHEDFNRLACEMLINQLEELLG